MEFEFTVSISCPELDYNKDVELVATGTYTPFCAGSRENGVPMEPDEPESWEIDSIHSASTYPDRLEMIIVEEMNAAGNLDELIEVMKNE